MKKSLVAKMLKIVPLAAVAAFLLFANATPAHARPCFTDLANCYVDAASEDSFWYRWARGLDCELDFVSCTRQDLLGR